MVECAARLSAYAPPNESTEPLALRCDKCDVLAGLKVFRMLKAEASGDVQYDDFALVTVRRDHSGTFIDADTSGSIHRSFLQELR